MVNKILIRTSDRKTLHKDRRSLGMNGENLQEVLLFCLDEKIEGTGIVEVELPDETKGMIEVECTEEGYELPIKSSLMAQTGFVKFQLRILHDNEEIFKSEIIALEVKDSINATETIPEQYPTWIDTLTRMKQDLEKAESERVSNENERISAEEARQENFTEMQETISSAVSNIKDLTDKYNENDKQKTEAFNKNFEEKQKAINDNAEAKTTAFDENAEAQTKTFNTNSDDKLAEYNKNHTAKMKEFDDDYDTKTKTFDDNAAAKLDEYNKNDKTKTDAYNNNASNKEETFNTNAADKQNEFNENASDKLAEYNQNAKELINKVEQVQAENETLKAENKLIKEQIPSASASGNSIHIEDSSNLEISWKLRGGHRQDTREGYNLINTNKDIIKSVNSGVTWNGNSYVFNGLTVTWEFDKNDLLLSVHIKGTATEGTNIHIDKRVRTYSAGTYTIYQDGMFVENIGWFRNDTSVSTRTFDEEWTTTVNSIYISSGETIDRTYTPMLLKGTYTSDTIPFYEQYGASPSPNYPSEIETVGSNVNLCDNSKNTVGVDPTNSSNQNHRTSDYIEVKYGKSYIASLYNEKKERIANLVYQTWDKNKKKIKEIYTDIITITDQDIGYVSVRNYIAQAETIKGKYYYKFEEGIVATPCSPFGMGSVETDVVNSNLLDFNVAQDSRVTVNEDGTLTINGTGGFSLNIDKIQFKAGITYYQKVELISGSISSSNINNTFLSPTGSGSWISSVNFSQTNLTKDTERTTLWINESAIFNNAVIKIWVNTDKSDFVKHQSQTAIMPIQQEMLEGDYVADVEHHEWKKLILTGVEEFGSNFNSNGSIFFGGFISDKDTNNGEMVCSNYLYQPNKTWQQISNYGFCGQKGSNNVFIRDDRFTTKTDFLNYLKQQYEAGTPVTIYYKLAAPVNLELTEEQKIIRDTKLYTYKNITNIILSDELASIDVEYKKDPTTEHDDLQNQIDEIKQLLSTTQTSALLLDNLQKDVETEVE